MSFLKRKKSLSISLVSVLMILTVSLFLFSCAKDYDTSEEIAAARVKYTDTVMISPLTLKNWLDNGYPGDIYGNNKVVVLFVGTQDQYDAGHIPGSQLVGYGDIKADRSDGVSMTIDMVATKAQMDGVIQKTGIDGGTLIVLTGPSGNFSFMNTSRAYYNFRYWGFPRSKLRVLDGFVDTTWADAGYRLEFETPTAPEASTYSVCYLKQYPDRFRAPLEDMINVAKDTDDKTVVIDTRSNAEYSGNTNSTPGSAGASSGEYVAFEGHIRGAEWMEYTNLLDSDGKLLSGTDLEAAMDAIGVNGTTTAYPYCRTSWRAAITFLALDGVLNYPVKLYDGAWIEWGQMTAQYGALDAGSSWITDKELKDISDAVVVDNTDSGFSVVGTWSTSTSAGNGDYYGSNFRYIEAGTGANSATWTPALSSAGDYDVYVWHTAKPVYETDAKFTVTHSGTTDTVTPDVNLTQNGGMWYKLGTYTFDAGGSEDVTVTDEATAGTYIPADAVAFVPAGTTSWLSEAVTYNANVESILANSFIPNADNVNRTDEEICAVEGPGGGGAGGGGDSGGY
ncbi:MAG: selenite/tellurite reduction operon rhodanese-like protein ExtH [Nitrospirota bacterium]|nr:selenite/tellurite reduction operon rhodanese-like protein ExtH [Nitrospirota bacterium]